MSTKWDTNARRLYLHILLLVTACKRGVYFSKATSCMLRIPRVGLGRHLGNKNEVNKLLVSPPFFLFSREAPVPSAGVCGAVYGPLAGTWPWFYKTARLWTAQRHQRVSFTQARPCTVNRKMCVCCVELILWSNYFTDFYQVFVVHVGGADDEEWK